MKKIVGYLILILFFIGVMATLCWAFNYIGLWWLGIAVIASSLLLSWLIIKAVEWIKYG
jgi:hypothetical protein